MSFDDFFHIYASVSPEERNRIEGMIDSPQEISAAQEIDSEFFHSKKEPF